MKGRPPSLSVPGYTISIPHSNLSPFPLTRLIFQPRLPFIKNRFQKALLPRDSTLYKSNWRNAPLHYSPLLTQSIHYPPKLPVYLQTVSWGWDKAVDKQSQTGVETDTQTLNFPLTFNHISFVVAVIVAVCGPVVNVEALDWSVVVTRGTILDGHGKKIKLGYSNLGDNYYTKRGNF